jgi:hypothetical protein
MRAWKYLALVMDGLVPAIDTYSEKDVDARDERGHDGEKSDSITQRLAPCLTSLILASTVLSAHAQVLGAVSPKPSNGSDAATTGARPELSQTNGIPAGNPLWNIPLNDLSATRERPIFSPSRRPPPPVAAPVHEIVARKSAEPDRPQLTLVGTVVGEREAIAVLLDPTTKNALRLKTGEKHEGWVLQSVRAREATFEKDRKTAVLTLPQPEGGGGLLVPTPTELPMKHRRFTYGH